MHCENDKEGNIQINTTLKNNRLLIYYYYFVSKEIWSLHLKAFFRIKFPCPKILLLWIMIS